MNDDPVLARLLRHPTGLKAGGLTSQHEVLATYHTHSGETPFAICRDGLLLNPSADARFVPFVEIEDAGYYNHEMVRRAKAGRVSGVSGPLSIRLRSGEVVDLSVEVREDGMPDLLTIASFIQQRATIYRAEERRAQPNG
ncbi:hypothetical protein [Sphingomonas sp.]|uniref:hypothetical protein n=1 Tax=Sphingomonas sp. TaxID=28214 RepID=UPI0025D1CDAE|nr:hypothetical protein [Sphingomonas sp.]